MKHPAFIRKIVLYCLIIVMAGVVTGSWAVDAAAADHYLPERFEGRSFVYRLNVSGSQEVREGNTDPVSTPFSMEARLGLVLGERGETDVIPFQGEMTWTKADGLTDQPTEKPIAFAGLIDADGTPRFEDVPPLFETFDLAFSDLFLGWIVPAPDRSPRSGTDWQNKLQRSIYDTADRTQATTLQGTYTSQGESDWGFRTLHSVTGRFRAESSTRSSLSRTYEQIIGHGIFYIDPETGYVDMSSVSLIVTRDVSPLDRGEPLRTKTSVTMTWELLEHHLVAPPKRQEAADQTDEPFGASPKDATRIPAEDEEVPGVPVEPITEREEEKEEDVTPKEDETEREREVAPQGDDPRFDVSDLPPADGVWTYEDPASRFTLQLDRRWEEKATNITLRGTEFFSPDTGEKAYVYVMPLPSPAATAVTIARSALATYGETLPGFRLLSEPQPDLINGDLAYRAHYEYVTEEGDTVVEWALFTRKRDRAYYLEYVPGPKAEKDGFDGLRELRDGFSFGDFSLGYIPPAVLDESLQFYTDQAQGFQMLIPGLWPLTERADGGASTTFTEIGEKGYLTIFAEGGAQNITAVQVLSAWRDEFSKEDEFRLIQDIEETTLGMYPGASFVYSWRGPANTQWTRRVDATIWNDVFYVVAIDYESDGFAERKFVFDAMVDSFRIIHSDEFRPAPLPGTADPDVGKTEPEGATEEEKNDESRDRSPENADAIPRPFSEPQNDQSVLLLGRILTRYVDDEGRMVEEWGKNLDVYVLANRQEYRGETDHLGYLYVDNLPSLGPNEFYHFARLDGAMLGFREPVTVSFDNLTSSRNAPRVSHLRTIILTLERDRSLTVQVVKAAAGYEEELSPPQYFIQTYPNSGWAEHVQEMIVLGTE